MSLNSEHNHTFFNVLLVMLCLIIGIIVVYTKVQNFDFVGFDDELYVTQNQYVQKGLSLEGIKWAFTTFHSANWHPLTWLSHMLDCELYGLNPAGHHWTNVEFHIANTLLLFFILFKMTGAIFRSALVAALFAIHPLHVESVAWISERKDVLSTFFGLLSIGAYYGYVKKSSFKYYLLVIVLISLGLMAKPMLVTLPFVLLLLDFWPLNRFRFQLDFHLKSKKTFGDAIRRNHRIILEKIPLFIPIAISCIITFFAQKSGGAVKAIWALPMKYRIENAVVSYVKYILKTVWPDNLAVFYPHPGNTLAFWQIFGAALLIFTACYWAMRSAQKYPYIPVGLFWYLGTLIPVIGLVQVGDQAMADRYTYIPLVGIFIIAAWGIPDLLKRLGDQTIRIRKKEREKRKENIWQKAGERIKEKVVGGRGAEIVSAITDLFKQRRFQKIFLGVSALTILVALSWISFFQLNTWRNGITLFEHAVSVTEKNYSAHNNLGKAYEPIDLDKAIFHYKKALTFKPNDDMVLFNLGNALLEKGCVDEAIRHYLSALKIKPDYPAALNNLGEAFGKKGDYDKAIYCFITLLRTETEKSNVRMNLANVYYLTGNAKEAISQYKEILRTDSDNADAHYNLAYVLSCQNKIKEAVLQFKETLNIDPKYSRAYYNLGHILLNQGKYSKAEVFFSEALQLDPGCSEARVSLDTVRKRISKSKTRINGYKIY